MTELNFIQILKISIVIPILLVCSVMLAAYTFERLICFLRTGKISAAEAEKIKQHLRQGQVKEAIAACARSKNFITHAVEVALNAAHLPRSEMENVFSLYRAKLQDILSRRLGVFGTLAFIAPLLGLLGTVLGVIRAFRDLALSGSGGPSIVAAGIAEALVATAAGIAVAVWASVMYNYFTLRLRGILNQFDILGQEIMILIYTGHQTPIHAGGNH